MLTEAFHHFGGRFLVIADDKFEVAEN